MKYFSNKYFDFKIGMAGAFVMGTAVFCINYFSTNLVLESITAALKQGLYTFLFGGLLMKSCEYLATHIKKSTIAIFSAVFIPSVVTLILTYCMHLFKGTPKPLESTFPTLVIIPATIIWAVKKRNGKTMGYRNRH